MSARSAATSARQRNADKLPTGTFDMRFKHHQDLASLKPQQMTNAASIESFSVELTRTSMYKPPFKDLSTQTH
jgi:hypothetical protein